MKKVHSGGFIVLEFAIALPLLILVMYGLAIVSVKIFFLSKEQLADYVLEAEARYVMELITQKARAAQSVETDTNKITIIYHAVDDNEESYRFNKLDDSENAYWLFSDKDVLETQIICPHTKNGREYPNLYAERQENIYKNPITGENFFGDTKLNSLKCDVDEAKKILHIELEMESLVTPHKIKIATAVFMPSYGE